MFDQESPTRTSKEGLMLIRRANSATHEETAIGIRFEECFITFVHDEHGLGIQRWSISGVGPLFDLHEPVPLSAEHFILDSSQKPAHDLAVSKNVNERIQYCILLTVNMARKSYHSQ
jgi:hypothetical protein